MRISNVGGGAGYLRFDSSSNFMQSSGLARIYAAKTISAAGATPSLADTELAVITQSGATNVTGFTGNLGYSRVYVEFGDAHSTLVHSSTLVLKSGSNETPSAGDVKCFLGSSSGQTWREI